MTDDNYQVPKAYEVSYRPEDTDMKPVSTGIIYDSKRLDSIKKGTTTAIRHGLAVMVPGDLELMLKGQKVDLRNRRIRQ